MLARALHCRVVISAIPVVHNHLGEPVHNLKDISQTFHSFCSILYNIVVKFSSLDPAIYCQKIKQSITETALPTLPEEVITQLDSPFQLTELQEVISSLSPGKSPGPDSLRPRFYKILQEALSFTLCLYNSISQECQFGPQK